MGVFLNITRNPLIFLQKEPNRFDRENRETDPVFQEVRNEFHEMFFLLLNGVGFLN